MSQTWCSIFEQILEVIGNMVFPNMVFHGVPLLSQAWKPSIDLFQGGRNGATTMVVERKGLNVLIHRFKKIWEPPISRTLLMPRCVLQQYSLNKKSFITSKEPWVKCKLVFFMKHWALATNPTKDLLAIFSSWDHFLLPLVDTENCC